MSSNTSNKNQVKSNWELLKLIRVFFNILYEDVFQNHLISRRAVRYIPGTVLLTVERYRQD
jgi:hypothetical protein